VHWKTGQQTEMQEAQATYQHLRCGLFMSLHQYIATAFQGSFLSRRKYTQYLATVTRGGTGSKTHSHCKAKCLNMAEAHFNVSHMHNIVALQCNYGLVKAAVMVSLFQQYVCLCRYVGKG